MRNLSGSSYATCSHLLFSPFVGITALILEVGSPNKAAVKYFINKFAQIIGTAQVKTIVYSPNGIVPVRNTLSQNDKHCLTGSYLVNSGTNLSRYLVRVFVFCFVKGRGVNFVCLYENIETLQLLMF